MPSVVTPDVRRLLVVQPSWVGDAVMATPTLRALRQLFPTAHIAYLLRRYVKPVYNGMPWADQLITYRTGKSTGKAGRGQFVELAARLRAARFDTAVLLPNSFKSALVCKMARIERIIGYERDGRSFLLTDKLVPAKDRGKFVPTPIIKTYLGIARYLGSPHQDLTMQLFATPSEEREGQEVLARAGLDPQTNRPAAAGAAPLVILNPGAGYGPAKCWPPAYFAQVADALISQRSANVLICSGPKERPIVDAVMRAMRGRAIDLQHHGLTLGSLKEIIRRCDLMITNDTGPRHIAAAFAVPVITVFGPTHPQWTEIYFPRERQLSIPVFCGPCQKKICPLDHRCMTGLNPERVLAAAQELLAPSPIPSAGAAAAPAAEIPSPVIDVTIDRGDVGQAAPHAAAPA
jgi:heptosyltransferase-2